MDNQTKPIFSLHLNHLEHFEIHSSFGEVFSAGDDKVKVENFIDKLNQTHRPTIIQEEMHKFLVCWNNHEKGEKCDFETIDLS